MARYVRDSKGRFASPGAGGGHRATPQRLTGAPKGTIAKGKDRRQKQKIDKGYDKQQRENKANYDKLVNETYKGFPDVQKKYRAAERKERASINDSRMRFSGKW